MVVAVSLVEVGRNGLKVAYADGDGRISNEGDEEEACSEFWSGFLWVVQSRGPRGRRYCARAQIYVFRVDEDSRYVLLYFYSLSV